MAEKFEIIAFFPGDSSVGLNDIQEFFDISWIKETVDFTKEYREEVRQAYGVFMDALYGGEPYTIMFSDELEAEIKSEDDALKRELGEDKQHAITINDM